MLYLVTGQNQQTRRAHIETLVTPEGECFVFDETQGTIADLEHYIYPSLFMTVAPVIHLKYMLDSAVVSGAFLQTLLASPTLFLFEEIEVPATVVTAFQKAGAIVHVQKKIPTPKKDGDIFTVTKAITASDRKSRWIAYHGALATHPIEAIIGILYWKIRDMALTVPKEKERYMALYRQLLLAHAHAWRTGTALDIAIEKVLLMQ